MSLRGLLLLLALLAALGIALVAFKGPEEAAQPERADTPLLADFPASAVGAIRGQCPEGSYELRRKGAAWEVTSPFAAEADPREIATLVEALRSAKVGRVVAGAGVDAEGFGLGADACRVTLEIDGDAAGRAVAIGRTSPVGYERYARGPDGGIVFVDGSLYSAVARSAGAFRERRLIPADPKSVARFEIERPDGRVVMVREAGAWRMEVPVRDLAEPGEAERAVESATSLEIEGASPLSHPLESAPSRRIALRVDGRTAFVAAAGMGGQRVAWREGGSTVGLVRESALVDLDREAAAFRNRQVFNLSTPDVRRISITRGGASLSVSRPAEGEAWTAAENAFPPSSADGARVDALLERLRVVRARRVDTAKPPTPATGSIAIWAADGRELARASWGPLPPEDGTEAVWVTTPERPGALFRVAASSFGPIPASRADLAAP